MTGRAQARMVVQDIAIVWKRLAVKRRESGLKQLDEILAGEKQTNWKLTKSREKWHVYFEHERMVLDVIRSHLTRSGNRFFTEHDGFRAERPVDLIALQREILVRTGFDLKINENRET